MKRFEQFTSALALGIGMAAAAPLSAQEALPDCTTDADLQEFPCLTADQTEIESSEDLAEWQIENPDISVAGAAAIREAGGADAAADAEVQAEAAAEGVTAGAAADAGADAGAAAEEMAADAAGEAAEAADAAAEETADAAQAAGETIDEVMDEAEETVEQAQMEADDGTASDQAADLQSETPADSEPAVDVASQADVEAAEDVGGAEEAVTDPELAAEAEVEAQTNPDDLAAEIAQDLETGAAAEAAAADMEAESDTNETAEAGTAETAETAETADAEADLPQTTDQVQADIDADAQVDTAAGAVDAEADVAAAAAAGDEGEPAEVVEQTLTEEDVRTSSEEFETEVTGTATANAQATAQDEDDGPSRLEQALLLGLGSLAVGALLDNGGEVVSNTGDRVVVRENGELRVLRDENALLRQPGNEVRTERFADGSTRTIVERPDGVRIVTIRNEEGRVLRRTRVLPDGERVVLFDDTEQVQPVDVSELPPAPEARPLPLQAGRDRAALREALRAELARDPGRNFTLQQVRSIPQVRALAPQVDLEAINFATGSAAIRPQEADELADLGLAIADVIDRNPDTVFLVEGHTDAVGDAGYNLALSDRRAETVALALTEYFDVPPENLVTQGYGESQLRVPTQEAEPANRRAVVRNITGLLR